MMFGHFTISLSSVFQSYIVEWTKEDMNLQKSCFKMSLCELLCLTACTGTKCFLQQYIVNSIHTVNPSGARWGRSLFISAPNHNPLL